MKHRITIDGIKHETRSMRKFNFLKRCASGAEWLIKNNIDFEKGYKLFGYTNEKSWRVAMRSVGFTRTKPSKFYVSYKDLKESALRHSKGGRTAVLSKEIGLSVQLLGCKWRDVGYSPKYKKYITKSSRPEINQKITYDSILYNKVLSYQPRIN